MASIINKLRFCAVPFPAQHPVGPAGLSHPEHLDGGGSRSSGSPRAGDARLDPPRAGACECSQVRSTSVGAC